MTTNLVWTDETKRNFRAKQAYAGANWKSIKNKYENICETFVSNLPK